MGSAGEWVVWVGFLVDGDDLAGCFFLFVILRTWDGLEKVRIDSDSRLPRSKVKMKTY